MNSATSMGEGNCRSLLYAPWKIRIRSGRDGISIAERAEEATGKAGFFEGYVLQPLAAGGCDFAVKRLLPQPVKLLRAQQN